jgi:hypothetical protein
MGRNGRTVYADQSNVRPEARLEDPAHSASRPELESTRSGREIVPAQGRPDGSETSHRDAPAPAGDQRREPSAPSRTRRSPGWTEPDVAEQPASYAIYRPETGSTTREPATPRVRSEAK